MKNLIVKIKAFIVCLFCFYHAQSQTCNLDQPSNQIICNDSLTATVSFTGGENGTVYNWVNSTPSIGLASNGSGNIDSFIAINPGNSPVTATISVTSSAPLAGSFAYIPLTYPEYAVAVISLATNSVVTTIPTAVGALGISLNADGTRVYVTCRNSNLVTIINATNNTVMNTIPVGSDPIGVWPSPDGSKLYVCNSTGNSVSVINLTTNLVEATVQVGSSPFGVTVSPDGTRVYVANRFSYSVDVIDATTNSLLPGIPVGGVAVGVALTPDGSRLYVTKSDISGTVAVINTATNTVMSTIPVGSAPTGIAMSHDGTRVYVANQLSNTISVINSTTNTVVGTIPTSGLRAYGVSVSPDDHEIFVTNYDSDDVSVINTINNTVVTTIPVGSTPLGLGSFINAGCFNATKSFTITVNPKNDPACSKPIISNEDSFYIKILPNIISNNAILRIRSNFRFQMNWCVYDAIGRKIMKFTQPVIPGQNDLPLQLGFLSRGVYFLRGAYFLIGSANENKKFTLRFMRL